MKKTQEILKSNSFLVAEINKVMAESPVKKPPEHLGKVSDDMFVVIRPKKIIDEIIKHLMIEEAAEAECKNSNAQRLSEITRLVDKWNNILLDIERN